MQRVDGSAGNVAGMRGSTQVNSAIVWKNYTDREKTSSSMENQPPLYPEFLK
jgi:hypothetical protein